MKKIFFLMVTFVVAACGGTQTNQRLSAIDDYGEGGRNACQYIKEKMTDQFNNIKEIEIIAEDSLLSERSPALNAAKLSIAGSNYIKGVITRNEYENIVNEYIQSINDIQNS